MKNKVFYETPLPELFNLLDIETDNLSIEQLVCIIKTARTLIKKFMDYQDINLIKQNVLMPNLPERKR